MKSINIILRHYSYIVPLCGYIHSGDELLKISAGSIKDINKENLRFAQPSVYLESAIVEVIKKRLIEYSNEKTKWTYTEDSIKIENFNPLYPIDYIIITERAL